MAYTGFADEFVQKQPRAGLLRRWFGGLFLSRSAARAEVTTGAPLAGPLPGDRRARGYLADLDIEVGF